MMLEFAEWREDIAGFISVSSGFYPQIGAYYEAMAEQWLLEYWDPGEQLN